MKTYKFKTNITCQGCLEKVKPFFDDKKEIKEWCVDLKSKEKILTVKAENMKAKDVKKVVENAGFQAEDKSGILSKIFS